MSVDWSKLFCQCGKKGAIWINPQKGAIMCVDCWNALVDFKHFMKASNPFDNSPNLYHLAPKEAK